MQMMIERIDKDFDPEYLLKGRDHTTIRAHDGRDLICILDADMDDLHLARELGLRPVLRDGNRYTFFQGEMRHFTVDGDRIEVGLEDLPYIEALRDEIIPMILAHLPPVSAEIPEALEMT